MLSQLTTLVLDCIDQLQTTADGIYHRKVFFVNGDGEGMSQMMPNKTQRYDHYLD